MSGTYIDHLMTSDKWHDVTQKLCHSSVLLTFFNAKRVEIVEWNM